MKTFMIVLAAVLALVTTFTSTGMAQQAQTTSPTQVVQDVANKGTELTPASATTIEPKPAFDTHSLVGEWGTTYQSPLGGRGQITLVIKSVEAAGVVTGTFYATGNEPYLNKELELLASLNGKTVVFTTKNAPLSGQLTLVTDKAMSGTITGKTATTPVTLWKIK